MSAKSAKERVYRNAGHDSTLRKWSGDYGNQVVEDPREKKPVRLRKVKRFSGAKPS